MIDLIKKYLTILQIFSVTFFLSNCGSTNTNKNLAQLSDTEIYSEGLISLQKGDYDKATLKFDEVFLDYPFSSLASKSEIMSAYSLYQNNKIEKAVTKLNSYIEMNPKGELTQYAHYLLAMCYYTKLSKKGRDPSSSKEALM